MDTKILQPTRSKGEGAIRAVDAEIIRPTRSEREGEGVNKIELKKKGKLPKDPRVRRSKKNKKREGTKGLHRERKE